MTPKDMDLIVGGLKAILDMELEPLRQRLTALEVQHRALRERLGKTAPPPARVVPMKRRA